MRALLLMIALTLLGSGVHAQSSDFFGSLGDSSFCPENPVELVGLSCSEGFYFCRGRISSPPLLAAGPVTIAVKTWIVNQHYILPVYVEIVRTQECSTRGAHVRHLILEAHGSEACGGVWETIGPIDLTTRYIPAGELYTIQLTLFDADPVPLARSVAVACLSVVSNPPSMAVVQSTWGTMKSLYRN